MRVGAFLRARDERSEVRCMVASVTEGTAEAQADTAATETKAPPDASPPESAEVQAAPETAPVAEPETAATATEPGEPEAEPEKPAEPEPPDLAALLGDLDEDAIAELDQVKGLLARREESSRRRSEAETASRISAERQDSLRKGEYRDALNEASELTDTTERGKAYDAVRDQMWQANAELAYSDLVTTMSGAIPKGATFSDDDRAALQVVVDDVTAGRRPMGEYIQALVATTIKVAVAAGVAEATPGLERAAETRARGEAKAAAKTDAIKTAEATRAEQAQPTRGVNGAGGPVLSTKTEYERELANATPNSPEERDLLTQMQVMRADGTWDRLAR